MLGALLFRSTVDVNILPERNPLFVTLADGSIRNGYTIKILNKERAEKRYQLGVAESEGLLTLAGEGGAAASLDLLAPPDGVGTHRVYLRLPREQVAAEVSEVTFVLTDTTTGRSEEFETIFRGPKR